jgi:hypothetical protein
VKVGGYQQRIVRDKAFPEGLARRWQGVGESRIPSNRVSVFCMYRHR